MVSADNHLHVKHTCNVCTTHASTSVVSFIIINAPSARVVSFKVVIEILSKRSYFTNTLWSHDRGKSISMFVGNTKISPSNSQCNCQKRRPRVVSCTLHSVRLWYYACTYTRSSTDPFFSLVSPFFKVARLLNATPTSCRTTFRVFPFQITACNSA